MEAVLVMLRPSLRSLLAPPTFPARAANLKIAAGLVDGNGTYSRLAGQFDSVLCNL
jgi:hypothetical protein